jgi:hypothetical protein
VSPNVFSDHLITYHKSKNTKNVKIKNKNRKVELTGEKNEQSG